MIAVNAYSIQGAADQLGVSYDCVWRMIRRGVVQPERFDTRQVLTPADLVVLRDHLATASRPGRTRSAKRH